MLAVSVRDQMTQRQKGNHVERRGSDQNWVLIGVLNTCFGISREEPHSESGLQFGRYLKSGSDEGNGRYSKYMQCT